MPDQEKTQESPVDIIDRIILNTSGAKLDVDLFLKDTRALHQQGATEDPDILAYLQDLGRDPLIYVGIIDRMEHLARQQEEDGSVLSQIRDHLKLAQVLGMAAVPKIAEYLKSVQDEFGEKDLLSGDYVWRAKDGDFPVRVYRNLRKGR